MRTRARLVRAAIAALVAMAAAAAAPACTDDFDAAAPADAEAPDGGDAAPAADADAGPRPKGARTLGVAVELYEITFVDQVRIVQDAGARTTNVTFAWDEIEPPPDDDAGADADADGGRELPFNGALHVAGLVLSGVGMRAELAFDAVDGRGARLPADLSGKSLDDPEVAPRYERAADFVLSEVPDLELSAFLVATDLDVALGSDPAKYAAFTTFFAEVADHVHAVRTGVPVGFVVTSDGLAHGRDLLASALAKADLVAVSHVGVVPADLDPIVRAAPDGKPIVVHAAGYPSVPDEDAQVAFVRGVFASWDRQADRIHAVTFFELDDPLDGGATFGLRRYADGRGKKGFGALTSEARARGF